MTGLNHVLTGITIAITVRQPVFAPLLSLMSHFILDSLPHFGKHPDLVPYNRNFKIYLALEAIAMSAILLVALIIFTDLRWLIVVCAAFAFLPDFFWLVESRLRHKNHFLRRFYEFHSDIQTGEYPGGWIIETAYFALLLCIVLFYASS